jgi:hypothetical protein
MASQIACSSPPSELSSLSRRARLHHPQIYVEGVARLLLELLALGALDGADVVERLQ